MLVQGDRDIQTHVKVGCEIKRHTHQKYLKGDVCVECSFMSKVENHAPIIK